jgi:GMP synthase (glutamine-hydrolysing)
MTVVAFRHMAGDGLGSLAGIMTRAGVAFEYIDTPRTDLSGFDALAPELLIVLGGSPGVYQKDIFPFLQAEMEIIKKRLAADRPVLGICLGAQLMAAALGADVYPGKPGSERGWHALTLTPAGEKSPVAHLGRVQTSMLHWHGDTFDFPEGATLLASSDLYRHQAFSYGRNSIGLQCHAEITPAQVEAWLIGCAGDIARGTLDVEGIRADTARFGQRLIDQTTLFMMEYLSSIGILKEGARHHA